MLAIEVRDLVKRYGDATGNAVDGISFDVPDGQLFCLLGPNGAGKTTTVSILTTVLAPTSGRVLVAGRDLATERTSIRGSIGIVFQQPALDANLTAEENIRLHAVLYGLYPWRPLYRLMPAAHRQQVRDLSDILDIAASMGRPVRSLSGGTRRKLEIVRALLHRPRVLFLDEPSTGLDPQSRRSLWSHLRETRAQNGTTVVLTTLAFPILLAAGLGSVLQPTVGKVTGVSAVTLAFTGVLAATLFQSTAAGMISIAEDRENDFSRTLFVAPVSRLTLVAGKICGEALVALFQGGCVVAFAAAIVGGSSQDCPPG